MAKRPGQQVIPRQVPVVATNDGKPLTVVGSGKSDADLAAEIRALLSSVVDRMNEAKKRGMIVTFNILPMPPPTGPYVLTDCNIQRVQSL